MMKTVLQLSIGNATEEYLELYHGCLACKDNLLYVTCIYYDGYSFACYVSFMNIVLGSVNILKIKSVATRILKVTKVGESELPGSPGTDQEIRGVS